MTGNKRCLWRNTCSLQKTEDSTEFLARWLLTFTGWLFFSNSSARISRFLRAAGFSAGKKGFNSVFANPLKNRSFLESVPPECPPFPGTCAALTCFYSAAPQSTVRFLSEVQFSISVTLLMRLSDGNLRAADRLHPLPPPIGAGGLPSAHPSIIKQHSPLSANTTASLICPVKLEPRR